MEFPIISIGAVRFHFKGCWVVLFNSILKANNGDPDLMPHTMDARLIWVKEFKLSPYLILVYPPLTKE